ncbi:MAG: glutamine synthetase III [Chitinophagaceae bacterium]
MSLRFSAISSLSTTEEPKFQGSAKITAIFGENVFTIQKAREYLSDEAYKSLATSIKGGKKIDRSVANQIANGLRAWRK